MAYKNYSTACSWIVDANGHGDFTTIAAAVTAANAGTGLPTANMTIFVRAGTYSGALAPTVAMTIAAYPGDGQEGNVIITGTITVSTAITVTISGIQLQTNLANFIVVSGSAASVVNLNNCYLNCTNNTGISYTTSSSSSTINVNYCTGNLGTTGIAYVVSTSAGQIYFNYCQMTNTGSSALPNSCSAGLIQINYTSFTQMASTSTGTIFAINSFIGTGGNAIAFNHQGSVNAETRYCRFDSGSGAAINIGGSSLVVCENCITNTSGTNAITGTGTLNIGFLNNLQSFAIASGITLNTTDTNVIGVTASAPKQPSFCAYVNANTGAVTGDGTAYTVIFNSKVYDKDSNYSTSTGLFTAPYTGVYIFSSSVYCTGLTSAMTPIILAITTNSATPTTATAATQVPRTAVTTDNQLTITGQFLMAAGDTCSMVLTISGGTKAAVVSGGSSLKSSFSGWFLG
jgi:hypothetical protein